MYGLIYEFNLLLTDEALVVVVSLIGRLETLAIDLLSLSGLRLANDAYTPTPTNKAKMIKTIGRIILEDMIGE